MKILEAAQNEVDELKMLLTRNAETLEISTNKVKTLTKVVEQKEKDIEMYKMVIKQKEKDIEMYKMVIKQKDENQ